METLVLSHYSHILIHLPLHIQIYVYTLLYFAHRPGLFANSFIGEDLRM